MQDSRLNKKTRSLTPGFSGIPWSGEPETHINEGKWSGLKERGGRKRGWDLGWPSQRGKGPISRGGPFYLQSSISSRQLSPDLLRMKDWPTVWRIKPSPKRWCWDPTLPPPHGSPQFSQQMQEAGVPSLILPVRKCKSEDFLFSARDRRTELNSRLRGSKSHFLLLHSVVKCYIFLTIWRTYCHRHHFSLWLPFTLVRVLHFGGRTCLSNKRRDSWGQKIELPRYNARGPVRFLWAGSPLPTHKPPFPGQLSCIQCRFNLRQVLDIFSQNPALIKEARGSFQKMLASAFGWGSLVTCTVPIVPTSPIHPLNRKPLLCSFSPCLNYRPQSLVTVCFDLLWSTEFLEDKEPWPYLALYLQPTGLANVSTWSVVFVNSIRETDPRSYESVWQTASVLTPQQIGAGGGGGQGYLWAENPPAIPMPINICILLGCQLSDNPELMTQVLQPRNPEQGVWLILQNDYVFVE